MNMKFYNVAELVMRLAEAKHGGRQAINNELHASDPRGIPTGVPLVA
jgi:hypothetical protein